MSQKTEALPRLAVAGLVLPRRLEPCKDTGTREVANIE